MLDTSQLDVRGNTMVSLLQDLCVVCAAACRPRQQCLQCDSCERWQHRTCKTDISQTFYRQLVKGTVDLDDWFCWLCRLKQTSHLNRRIRTTLQDVTSDLLDTDRLKSQDAVAAYHAIPTLPIASQRTEHTIEYLLESSIDAHPPPVVKVHDDSDGQTANVVTVPVYIANVAAYVDVVETQSIILPDVLPSKNGISPAFSSSQFCPTSTKGEDSVEDQISFMYVGNNDLLLPPTKTTPRSPSMPRLETSEPEDSRRFPSSTFTTPPPSLDISTSRTASSCPASPSSTELRLYLSETSYVTLTPLAPPRHLSTPENLPRWSETTDSPFPSPGSTLYRLSSTDADSDSWSPPHCFLSRRDDVRPRPATPFAELEDRLVKELKL